MEFIDFKTEHTENGLLFKMLINDGEQDRKFGINLGTPIDPKHLSEALKVLARKIDSLYLRGIELEDKDLLPREVLD